MPTCTNARFHPLLLDGELTTTKEAALEIGCSPDTITEAIRDKRYHIKGHWVCWFDDQHKPVFTHNWRPCFVDGIKYSSIKDAARVINASINYVNKIVNHGGGIIHGRKIWREGQPEPSESKIKYIVDGKEYDSKLSAREVLGCSDYTLNKMLRDGPRIYKGQKLWLSTEKYTDLDFTEITIKYYADGIPCRSIYEAGRVLGISPQTIRAALTHGRRFTMGHKVWPVGEPEPRRTFREGRHCIIDGIEYVSVPHAASELGLNPKSLKQALDYSIHNRHRGHTVEWAD